MPSEPSTTVQVDGAQIAYRRAGNGLPLLVLNGFAATNADWDPSFINGLASSNEVILVDNCGLGRSTDDWKPFDMAPPTAYAARGIDALGFEHRRVRGWML